MAPFKIPSTWALLTMRAHIAFTFRRVIAHPLTQSLVPTYTDLLKEWPAVQTTELELLDQIDDAKITVAATDTALNTMARRVSKDVLTIVGENHEDPLYQHLFTGKPLHLFTRPVLGPQLAAMKTWGPPLDGSGHPSLKALALELPDLIEAADEAAKAKAAALAKYDEFRDVGERKKYCDKLNAVRKESHGFLATLPFKHAGLPSNFADLFFRRARPADETEEEPTIESVEATIAELQGEMTEQQMLLATLKEAADKAAAEAKAKLAKAAQLEAIEKEMAEKKKLAAALRAELT
jgi:hypothetical protein